MSDSDVDVEYVPPSPQLSLLSQPPLSSQQITRVSRLLSHSLPPLPRLPDLREADIASILDADNVTVQGEGRVPQSSDRQPAGGSVAPEFLIVPEGDGVLQEEVVDVVTVEPEREQVPPASLENIIVLDPENDGEDSDTDVEVLVVEDGSRSPSPDSDIILLDVRASSNENDDSNSSREASNPPTDLQLLAATPFNLVPPLVRLAAHGESPADFRSPKRRRIMSSPEKTGKTEPPSTECNEDDDDDGDNCPICFEPWTNSGSHRLASLRCGHLFGQSCIQKWLRGQGGKCPHCNAKAKKQDIRVLYAKSVKAIDTSERDQALRELEKEKEARRRLEMQAAESRLQYQMAISETNKLRTELEQVRRQLHSIRSPSVSGFGKAASSQGSSSSQAHLKGQFVMDRTIKIWEAGNCRVLAYSAGLASLVVSQPSSSPLFPGFGIKKISTMDFRSSQYITLHSKAIRDVCFHPVVGDGILLSCGLDKQIKLTSIISNAIIATYETPMPVWSCIWNADDHNLFYAGMQNGTVLEFDTRNTASHVQELNMEGSRSPVRALQYVPQDPRAMFRSGGVMIGQLDRISFFEKQHDERFRPHLFPLEGSLTSLHFENSTRHLLASFRPTGKHATVRHQLCELTSTNLSVDPTVVDNVCTCNVIQTFYAGRTQTILSRTQMVPHPEDNSRLLVCAGEEESAMLHIWDSGIGQLKQRLFTGGMAMDICAININNQTYMAALTDKQLKILKWS